MKAVITNKTMQLDLHGEIVSMVEALVNQFINDAIKMKEPAVRIIHGKSTNILTKEVHRILKENKNVEQFTLNNWNLGETIVYLKH